MSACGAEWRDSDLTLVCTLPAGHLPSRHSDGHAEWDNDGCPLPAGTWQLDADRLAARLGQVVDQAEKDPRVLNVLRPEAERLARLYAFTGMISLSEELGLYQRRGDHDDHDG